MEQPISISETEPAVSHSTVRRVVAASTAGTALEWYDYFAYGTASALVFNRLFFPSLSPLAGTLVSFLAFASGFLMRPLGAVVFGHMGDRYGRKFTLLVTVTGMGIATGLIGLLPTYEAIGTLAPIFLVSLRLLQGLSVGGEWGGAATICLEHAPPGYAARYTMFVQMGGPMGTLLSTGMYALLNLLPGDDFISWGWRIPFLASFVFVFIGMYMRLRIEESPVFQEALERENVAKAPLIATLRTSWRQVVAGVFVVQSGFYVVTTFVLSYGTTVLGLPRPLILTATLLGTVVEIGVICIYGILADRYGAVRVFIVSTALNIVVAFPVFLLVDTKVPVLVTLGVVLGIAIVASPFGVLGVVLGKWFAVETRYTGLSVSYQVGSIASGFLPSICIGVLDVAGGRSWGVSALLVLIAIIALVGCLAGQATLKRTSASSIVSSL
ncbi:MHS family MFS transporter [Pseudonocardia kujensis]|uniref:MFS transporter n=1 Tax=Pseudonocardia kujensis TaxID=1128675 RepID=UPI001E5B0CF0|nr:MFS transporter [Pseudonocardia kujensis]MCE0764955.1 MHS family MFS transporter [Pseudonocardia kujensis]